MLLHIRQLCAGKEQVMAVKVDHNAIKFNQVSLTVVAVVAGLAHQPGVVGGPAPSFGCGQAPAPRGFVFVCVPRGGGPPRCVGAAPWLGLTWRSRRFRRRMAGDLLVDGRPLVLAFSTPDCVPCKTIQKPALEELQRRYRDRVVVREVDALAQPALAGRFGILTVPTTVVVGEEGAIVAINHGAVEWEKLALQLALNGDRVELRAREV